MGSVGSGYDAELKLPWAGQAGDGRSEKMGLVPK